MTWKVWLSCFTWWQMILDNRRWSAMFLYPCGQMSDCFTNVNVICITETFEFIHYIGQQRQGSMALRWKIIFLFERCENNCTVNTIIFYPNQTFNMFPTKYNRRQSNIGYKENDLNLVLFDLSILITLITFVILEKHLKGLMGILSGKTCLCLQMSRSKSVECLCAVYINFVSFIREKDSRELKSIKW